MTTAADVEPADAEVTVAITRDPSLVRTVRLVTAAVARRAGLEDTVIEEVRLAVGEACAVLIGVDEGEGPASGSTADDGEQVTVGLNSRRPFTVTVSGRLVDAAGSFEQLGDELEIEPFALVRGLSDDLSVDEADGLVTLRMTWPG